MKIFRSAETLRSDVVNDLRDIEKMNGVPIELFAGVPVEQYSYEISSEVTYGDEITVRSIASILNIEVVIILTLGECGRTNNLPQHSIPLGRISLDFFVEGHGKHYFSLEQVKQISDEYDDDEASQQTFVLMKTS